MQQLADKALQLERQTRQLRATLNQAGRSLAVDASRGSRCSRPRSPLPTANSLSTTSIASLQQKAPIRQEPATPLKRRACRHSAVRLTILPESDDPHRWPEQGSSVSKLEIAELGADGESSPLAIQEVFADHLAGPHDPRDTTRDNWQGFGGYPKLNGPRWAVFVLAESYLPAPGASLLFTLHQKGQVTGSLPTHVRRLAMSTSDAREWQQLANSPERADLWKQHDSLLKERSEIKGVSVPVMQSRDQPRSVTRGSSSAETFLIVARKSNQALPEILHPLRPAHRIAITPASTWQAGW